MKKYLFFIPLVVAVLASCNKEISDDSGKAVSYVEEGLSIVASAELSKVTVNIDDTRENPSFMSWEAGDHISVFHNGQTYDFVTATSGETAVFHPVDDDNAITAIVPELPLIAYYNVTSVAANGTATFSIPAEQTEGELSNKVPLYAYSATTEPMAGRVQLTFNPMASVLEFKVSAALSPLNATTPSKDPCSYELTKVVLTPNSGASGYNVMTSGTVNPATGAITPSSSSLSAMTFHFSSSTDIAGEEGKHFQLVIGKCQMNNTGAVMDWYKGDILNYTKSIWASKDIDFSSGYKHVYQPIAQKVVGIGNYSDYYSKFFAKRNNQADFINICDDERSIILTNDIYFNNNYSRACCFPNLSWNFDGKGHALYGFAIDDTAAGQNRIYGFFSAVQADIKNLSFGKAGGTASITMTDSSDSRGTRAYGAITDVKSGNIENVTSYINFTLTFSKTDRAYFAGGVVGYMSGGTMSCCHNHGTITVTQAESAQELYVGGVLGMPYGTAITVDGSQNHADVDVTRTGSGKCYVGGIVGRFRGLAITGCENQAENLNVTLNGTGESYIAGVMGNSHDSPATYSGLKNGSAVSVTRTNPGNSYTGGIAGHLWAAATFTGCENSGNVSFVSTYEDTYDLQIKTGGLFARVGSNAGTTVSNCVNAGNVTAEVAVAPTSASFYSVGGLIADFQIGNSMSACVQRGSITSIKTAGAYVANRACWLAQWTVLDNVTATPSASVLSGITVNGVEVNSSNYTKKNVWASQNSPSTGVLVLLTE